MTTIYCGQYMCPFITLKGTRCQNRTNYKTLLNNKIIYCCGTHCKKNKRELLSLYTYNKFDKKSFKNIGTEIPSENNTKYWIYHKKDNKYEENGKIMFFYKKGDALDSNWHIMVDKYNQNLLEGIKSMKVSTNLINPRAIDDETGVIICYCNQNNAEKACINILKYITYFYTCIYFKTNKQTQLGTCSTGQKYNHTCRILNPQNIDKFNVIDIRKPKKINYNTHINFLQYQLKKDVECIPELIKQCKRYFSHPNTDSFLYALNVKIKDGDLPLNTLIKYKKYRENNTNKLFQTRYLTKLGKYLGIKCIIHTGNQVLRRGDLKSNFLFELGFFKNHIFLYEKCGFTTYALEHMLDDEFTEKEDWNLLVMSKGKEIKRKDRIRNSFWFIKRIIELGIVDPYRLLNR